MVSCPRANRHWFEAFVSRCQDFAGRTLDASTGELVGLLRSIADNIPGDASFQERLAIRNVLGRLVAGLGRAGFAHFRAEVACVFLEWSGSDVAADDWRSGLTHCVSECAAALERVRDAQASRPYARCAARLLRTIDERFTDPRLTIEHVASQSGASVRHAARVLKGETGQTFLAHLHHARITAACQVLTESTMSVKETAITVGYVSSSEFGKHFKRLVGTTPAKFRLDHGGAPADGRNAR